MLFHAQMKFGCTPNTGFATVDILKCNYLKFHYWLLEVVLLFSEWKSNIYYFTLAVTVAEKVCKEF